jgi:hypothetical protein
MIEKFGTNFINRLWGLLASPMPISEEQKTNERKLSLFFAQRLTAASVAATYVYLMIRMEEILNENNFNNKYFTDPNESPIPK